MQANILDGVYIRVGGDAGKTNGLPWHILESMFDHLQVLVTLLAKYELETDNSPNLKDFEIEIFDFKPGSAVPAFRISPKSQFGLYPIIDEQKQVVAKKFDKLMSYANEGAYEEFFREDQLVEVKQDIAEELNGFIRSTGNSPLSIVRPIAGKKEFEEIYKVPKFTKQQAEKLLKPKIRRKNAEEPENILALVQRIGKRRTIVDLYENKDTNLSIAPLNIIAESRTYVLHNPLVCLVNKEDGNFIISNEMLDIYAAGEDLDNAEHDLYKEFDETYRLLNKLQNSELSERLLRAKTMINSYVKEIIKE